MSAERRGENFEPKLHRDFFSAELRMVLLLVVDDVGETDEQSDDVFSLSRMFATV